METIISGVISGVFAVVVCVITQTTQNRKQTALIEYKLDELSKRVDKHNQVIERTFRLEETDAVQNTQIKALQDDVAELKHR